MRLDKIQEARVLVFGFGVFSLKMMTKFSVVSVRTGLCCPKELTIVQLWGWIMSASSGAEGDRGKA